MGSYRFERAGGESFFVDIKDVQIQPEPTSGAVRAEVHTYYLEGHPPKDLREPGLEHGLDYGRQITGLWGNPETVFGKRVLEFLGPDGSVQDRTVQVLDMNPKEKLIPTHRRGQPRVPASPRVAASG